MLFQCHSTIAILLNNQITKITNNLKIITIKYKINFLLKFNNNNPYHKIAFPRIMLNNIKRQIINNYTHNNNNNNPGKELKNNNHLKNFFQ